MKRLVLLNKINRQTKRCSSLSASVSSARLSPVRALKNILWHFSGVYKLINSNPHSLLSHTIITWFHCTFQCSVELKVALHYMYFCGGSNSAHFTNPLYSIDFNIFPIVPPECLQHMQNAIPLYTVASLISIPEPAAGFRDEKTGASEQEQEVHRHTIIMRESSCGCHTCQLHTALLFPFPSSGCIKMYGPGVKLDKN